MFGSTLNTRLLWIVIYLFIKTIIQNQALFRTNSNTRYVAFYKKPLIISQKSPS